MPVKQWKHPKALPHSMKEDVLYKVVVTYADGVSRTRFSYAARVWTEALDAENQDIQMQVAPE